MDEIVTDPAVLAKLPHAGRTRMHWHWFWFAWMWNFFRGTGPRFSLRSLLYLRMRCANAESVTYGPLNITRPKPWLLGPARQLHPEAFKQEEQEA